MILLSITTIVSSIVVFLLVILTLVGILLFVKTKLTPSGKITIKINGKKEIIVDAIKLELADEYLKKDTIEEKEFIFL